MPEASDRSARKLSELLDVLQGNRSLLIVMQDNPDPDSIASAAALRRLARNRSAVQCSIAYGGVIGRGENRALADYLGLNFRPMTDIDLAKFDLVAIVDTQPNTGNNALPAGFVPDIVLDHHPLRPESRSARFHDVRSKYGALSTILFEYLVEAGIKPGPPLATALLYAVRTDTHDLGPAAIQADIDAFEALYSQANPRMLSAIQRGSVRQAYYQSVGAALKNARLYGESLISAIGEVEDPDITGETADLFIRHEGVRWVLTYVFHHDKAWLSLRTSQTEITAAEVMKKIVSRIGTGGGHRGSAGGQIPLRKGTRAERTELGRKIRDRFLRYTRAGETRGRKLVQL